MIFRTEVFEYVDRISASYVASIKNPLLDKVALFITDIGGPGSVFMYCLVLVMGMWLHKKYTHLIQFILTMSLTAFVAVLTKEILKVPRPVYASFQEVGYSFASAHALIATVFFLLIFFSYKEYVVSKAGRVVFLCLTVSVILLVSATRVYLGVHYMSDVVAGIIVGLFISSVSMLMYERHKRRVGSLPK